ncbi:MAG: hypothetical protein WC415_00770 [Patescibacteria group bacterium]|jgi:hypothetical protein
MDIISKNKKLIIYAILAVFVVLFFIYFFKQDPNTSIVIIEPATVSAQSQVKSSVSDNPKINLDFFKSDKFRNLRFDKMPAVVFPVGKRDPFVPME